MNIIYTCVIIAALAGCYYFWSNRRKQVFSFKTAMELAELPVIVMYVNDKPLHLLLDTGANKSIINKSILKHIPFEVTAETSKITGINGESIDSNFVLINLTKDKKLYEGNFQVVDLTSVVGTVKRTTGVTIHGILGTDFFNKYKYVIDFHKLIAYTK